MKERVSLLALSALLLGGCSTLAGYDAGSAFNCAAPPGATCESISGVYANSLTGNLPDTSEKPVDKPKRSETGPLAEWETVEDGQYPVEDEKVLVSRKISPRVMDALSSGMPIRQPPLVLRVWVAPWESAVGDLHDQSYFYAMVHSGKWLIEANRKSISNQFRPVFPIGQGDTAPEAKPLANGSPAQRNQPRR